MVANDTSSAASTAMTDGLSSSHEDKARSGLTYAPPGLQVDISEISFQGQTIFQDLSLTLEPGKITCLLGPSGVGKTSILKTIAGFLPLAPGSQITSSDNKPVSGRISYMDQSDLLLPWASSLDNVMIAARLRGDKADIARAKELLELVGLADKMQEQPARLSGGMRQRVALARTLMDDTPFVLVDEPFSALDAITRHRLQDLTAKLLADKTVLMITHDPMEALRLGHHIRVLSGNPVLLSPDLKMEGDIPRDPMDDALKPRYELILSMLGMQQGPAR